MRIVETLKSAFKHKTIQSAEYADVKDTLLLSIPNSENREGLVLLDRGTLYVFDISGCTGLWLEGETLYIAEVESPDYSTLRILRPGQKTKTVISSVLGDAHDVRIWNGDLLLVSTATNEVVKIDEAGKILGSWKQPGAGDCTHINCFDVWGDKLVATSFGPFDTYRGYKGKSRKAGVVSDVMTHEVISGGYSSPHTPRRDEEGSTYVCDSQGETVVYQKGAERKEIKFPGAFTRGLAFTETEIYVGLSGQRKSDPTEGAEGNTARVAILDRKTHEQKHIFSIPQLEIYDVLILR